MLLGCLALGAVYAAHKVAGISAQWPRMLVWFVAAAVLHDLLLFPVYTGLDRVLLVADRAAPRRVPLVNHLRVPAALSALLLGDLVAFDLRPRRRDVPCRERAAPPRRPHPLAADHRRALRRQRVPVRRPPAAGPYRSPRDP